MAKKKPTFDRAVSREDAKNLRSNNLQPTENVAILDDPDTYHEKSYDRTEPPRPSIAHSNAKDVQEQHAQNIEDHHEYYTKISSHPIKGYTKKDAARDVEGSPVSGDDLAKMGRKSLYATYDRDGYDVNDTPEVPPDRANDSSRRMRGPEQRPWRT